MTRTSKENYIKTHFPNYMKINALFDHKKVQEIIDALLYVGMLKPRAYDYNYETVKNQILRMQNKYKQNIVKDRVPTIKKERI
jgi:hypothetical protein